MKVTTALNNQSKSVRYEQGISYMQMNSRTKLILPFVIRLKIVVLNIAS